MSGPQSSVMAPGTRSLAILAASSTVVKRADGYSTRCVLRDSGDLRAVSQRSECRTALGGLFR